MNTLWDFIHTAANDPCFDDCLLLGRIQKWTCMFAISHARQRNELRISHIDTTIVTPITKNWFSDQIGRLTVANFHSAIQNQSPHPLHDKLYSRNENRYVLL